MGNPARPGRRGLSRPLRRGRAGPTGRGARHSRRPPLRLFRPQVEAPRGCDVPHPGTARWPRPPVSSGTPPPDPDAHASRALPRARRRRTLSRYASGLPRAAEQQRSRRATQPPALAGPWLLEVTPGSDSRSAALGYDPAPIMGIGLGASLRLRAGLLAGAVIPLVLLAGVPASAWHGEHPDERECAVCHSGHETADLSRPVELIASRAGGPTEPEADVPRGPSRRFLRRPARAPPA